MSNFNSLLDFGMKLAEEAFELAAEHPKEATAIMTAAGTAIYSYGHECGKAEGKYEGYKEATERTA